MEKYFQSSESKTVFLDQLERINGPSVISLLAYTNNSSGMSVSFTLLFRCHIYKKQLHTVNTSQFCRSNSFLISSVPSCCFLSFWMKCRCCFHRKMQNGGLRILKDSWFPKLAGLIIQHVYKLTLEGREWEYVCRTGTVWWNRGKDASLHWQAVFAG